MPRKFHAHRLSLGSWVVAGVFLSACGSTTSGTGATPTPAPTPTPTATPIPLSGPPAASVSFVGGPGVSKPFVINTVTCQGPSLQGLGISVYAQQANNGYGTLIGIRQGVINVRLAQGSGTVYTERIFSGTGVTNFNAATGATFSGPVTEEADPGAKKGTIPSISSISGSVSCNGQQPGSGTVTITGPSVEGQFSQPLSPIRVNCIISPGYPEGMLIQGLTMAGTTPVLVEIGGGVATGTNTTQFFVSEVVSPTVFHFYSANVKAVTITGNQIMISGSVVEGQVKAGGAVHTLMVSGQATCGSSTIP
jgi:hypothetical protein